MSRKPKPKGPDAKSDLKALQTAMNKGTIPDRPPGQEVVARTESGASVTITGDGAKKAGEVAKRLVAKLKRGEKLVQAEASALVPPLDGVGRAAKRLVEAVRTADAAAEEKGEAESNLIRALRKSKRTSFKCDGINLLLTHVGPKDKITIQKPK